MHTSQQQIAKNQHVPKRASCRLTDATNTLHPPAQPLAHPAVVFQCVGALHRLLSVPIAPTFALGHRLIGKLSLISTALISSWHRPSV
ncbi:uncharacterized protein CLUP02_11148 [Colletotrichum lupini]|uniref:Uncharacterized protein n=1 Tax=Colletotrichum lupini TaxID=145971 RepID=A0A9Q8SXX7_9PEZI|nr:uncharacterized protein CLUP02_11148 [Colletotrichum lupini]UQC85649.1 hypothetical protein CLUP02_11148 [Colletotrichum lupini]